MTQDKIPTRGMSCVSVRAGVSEGDSYQILIAPQLLRRLPALMEKVQRKKRLKIHRRAVITDSNLKRIYGKTLVSLFGDDTAILSIPAGESSKSREMKNYLEDKLIAARYGRDSAILAFGGGVVGDLAGFVAATYYRGVPYFQVPTTVISQVDSSIGGKTAIDVPSGKNLIGCFYPPQGVFMDVDLLDSLPSKEFTNGLAEVLKHAMIRDHAFFDYLDENAASILAKDKNVLVEMLRRSCEIKAGVVSEDPKESNLRKILNFGHTVAHALETLSEYQLLHGQAVSIGMAVEGCLAWKAGYLPSEKYLRLLRLIRKFGLPANLPRNLSPEKIIKVMGLDKKNEGGKVHFSLPRKIGEMKKIHGKYGLPLNMALVESVLREYSRAMDEP